MTDEGTATLFRGGASIDLGRRMYGIKRLRATYPSGHLKVTQGEASLWVTPLALPPEMARPVVTKADDCCVFVRGWPPGVGIRTPLTVHWFWTLHPGRIATALEAAGFTVCS
jgi:hypothetical protein